MTLIQQKKGSINLGYFGAGTHKDQNSSILVSQKKLGKELDIQIKKPNQQRIFKSSSAQASFSLILNLKTF